MRRVALSILAIAALVGTAAAQTDDRISNDAIQLLAADAVVSEIGALCLADTGGDPAMASAMAGWSERNKAWQIVAVATLGSRGADYSAESITSAKEALRAQMLPNYEASGDKAAWCARMASDIDGAQMSAGTIYADAARRIEEARTGKWPVLDVAKSIEVWSAYRVRERFHQIEYLMQKCAESQVERQRHYNDAYPYWRSRNFPVLQTAETVIQGWGALAPQHGRDAEEFGRLNVSILFYDADKARARCEAFVAGVEDGAEDLATTDPALVENVERYAANLPGAE